MKTPDLHCKKCNWTGDTDETATAKICGDLPVIKGNEDICLCPECFSTELEPYFAYESRMKAEQSWISREKQEKEAKKGKTLRQWFAGMALANLNLQAHIAKPASECLAKSAFNIADAMIEFEEKENGRNND